MAWQKTKDMNRLIQTQIPFNKTRILFKGLEPLFFEVCSNPAYYEKLHEYGLVGRETIDKASEITKNMHAFSYDEQTDQILKVNEIIPIKYEDYSNQ